VISRSGNIRVAMSDNLFIDVATLRAVILDVLDSGDISADMWEGDFDTWEVTEDEATENRGLFVDAVIKRVQTLCAPPFNLGVKLENYCPRHIKMRLPVPSAISCADCEEELREKL